MTTPESLRVLRRSPGRLRIQAASLTQDRGIGLARIAAADGVLEVRISERTGNVLIGFDPGLIDEPGVLSLITDEPALDRPRRARRGRAAAQTLAQPGWLRAERTETLPARPAACVAELIDFERYPEWQSYVKVTTVLERDHRGRGTRVATEAQVGERELRFTTRYRFPSPNRVKFEQDDGELEAVRGSWAFQSLTGGRSRATHVLEVKPGWRLGLVLRNPLYAQLRETVLDHFISELRVRLEEGVD